MGDYQVRFCEGFRGETPLYLLDVEFDYGNNNVCIEYKLN